MRQAHLKSQTLKSFSLRNFMELSFCCAMNTGQVRAREIERDIVRSFEGNRLTGMFTYYNTIHAKMKRNKSKNGVTLYGFQSSVFITSLNASNCIVSVMANPCCTDMYTGYAIIVLKIAHNTYTHTLRGRE